LVLWLRLQSWALNTVVISITSCTSSSSKEGGSPLTMTILATGKAQERRMNMKF
jgi:hypothetical protein